MTCPGSKLLTSDMDCTLYHSTDSGALISRMNDIGRAIFQPLVADPTLATLEAVFDANLYGTWTWIPDEIFKRFPWPRSSKDLFEEIPAQEGMPASWVLRTKCSAGAR